MHPDHTDCAHEPSTQLAFSPPCRCTAPAVKATEAPVSPYYPNGAFNPSYTALGAYEKKGAVITGLIYEVNKQEYDNTVRAQV